MALATCAGCGERFGGVRAFDRHLLVRRVTVTTPAGHVVHGEQVVTCRPVESFSDPAGESGGPRLVRSPRGVWVTKTDDRFVGAAL